MGTKIPTFLKKASCAQQNGKKVFQEVSLDNIYSTDFYRTQETAAPLAEEKNITVVTYDPTDLFNPSFKEKNKGKVVLVVGHSNTTPALANKIIGKQHYSQIDENTFGKLYIIHIQADAISHQLLNIE
jgi:2,3-bisphosphoglycerate-dependent phosphoglycerate mutase